MIGRARISRRKGGEEEEEEMMGGGEEEERGKEIEEEKEVGKKEEMKGMYDGGEHTPKLLCCSHTVCLHCLTRIAGAANGGSSGSQNAQQRTGSAGANSTFRCPICRECITIPRGGVAALPPSFLVNQLLDLMARQRREVVPKCSVHLNQVTSECNDVQYLVEVRNITQRIGALGDKLESATLLAEPRENAFVACDLAANTKSRLDDALATLGRVRTSTTLPKPCTVNLEATAILSTVDYHGNARTNGGDPITAEVARVNEEDANNADSSVRRSRNEEERGGGGGALETEIVDKEDGTYLIKFRPNLPGKYQIKVTVLDRPVRHSPLTIEVSEHNNPVKVFGSRGSGKEEFLQPVAVSVNNDGGAVYVVDTGNSRVKVLTPDLHFIRHLECDGLTGRSCTGIAVNDTGGWLAIINWRSKLVTRLNHRGESLDSFTYEGFQEPIDIAIDCNYGHILVADNGPCCVYVFDTEGKLLFQVGKKGSHKGNFNLISSVTVGPGGEIIVADSRIQVFSAKGDFLQEIYSEGKGRGRYGGVAVDQDGMLVASRAEKGRNFIQVFQLCDGQLLSTVDSHDAKLKRPSGLATTADRHVIVVDLGNDCVKKYRYW
ncbi:hypothetical protein LSTR_LSTR012572 [Laodelphax striatellus]|uniref:RING-type domain-containing protein n=2 Tax=Laodelphax striatellus TaxID=195883 RepID=A0A482WP31_LAOST|nr:hypothetical protein LSTR_LSTR012572 [Laodelphax striatellus]